MKTSKLYVLLGALLSSLLIIAAGCKPAITTSAAATGEFDFLVTDQSGNPLSGAKVVSDSQPDGQLKLTGITYAAGKVTFQNAKAGDYSFYINRFDYYQTEVAVTLPASQVKSVTVKLSPSNVPSTTPATSLSITFAQLTVAPEMYHNQTVTITGFWFDGFEIEVLAERLDPSDFAPGNLQPAGTEIWVQNGLPSDVSAQLFLQPNNSTGYPAHYGKVELTGMLEYGGHYGHMNAYQYQLTVQSASFIPWIP